MITFVTARASAAALVVVVMLYAAAVGFLYPIHDRFAIAMALVGVLAALLWNDTTRLAVLAVPGVWLIARVPGIDVSVTDVLVTSAGVAALVAGVGGSLQRPARLLLGSFGIYLGSLGITLVANHSLRSDLELLHRVGIVVGGVLAGAWLVRQGRQHHALRALLLVTSVISAAAVIESVAGGFRPAEVASFNKNLIGSFAATTLLTVLAAGSQFRLPRLVLASGALLTALGLAASQSRGGMIAVVLGSLIWFLRAPSERRRQDWKLAVASALAFGTIAAISLRDQVDAQTADTIDSITQRLEVEAATGALWQDNPVTGVGLRFFATPAFAGFQPPNNVLNEILAEAGFPGLVGFLVLVIGTVVALWRCSGDLALAGLCVVSARFAHGLVDIYWVGGTTTLPWLIAGMGVAGIASRASILPSHLSRRPSILTRRLVDAVDR